MIHPTHNPLPGHNHAGLLTAPPCPFFPFSPLTDGRHLLDESNMLAELGPLFKMADTREKVRPRVLVVNLFGGPGTGKSSNALLTTGKLKVRGINAEYVPEYAKDLTWEERHAALAFQPYVTLKQMWRVARLRDQLDVIVTDSPFILGLVYGGWGVTPSFEQFVLEVYDLFDNDNIFLVRDPVKHPYNPRGRSQTEDEAMAKDAEIRELLRRCELPFDEIPILDDEETANIIRDRVLAKLANR